MDERIKNKNVLYFILSILVVLSHNQYYTFYDLNNIKLKNITRVISDYSCNCLPKIAVPIFMFFYGLLFYKRISNYKDLIKKIKKRFVKIVLPFFVWNIISMIWTYLMSIIPFIKNNVEKREFFVLSTKNIIEGLFFYKYDAHKWFLAALCIFLIVSPIIFLFLKNKKIGFLSLTIIFFLYCFGIKLPIELKEDSCLFYLLGSFVGIHYYDEFVKFSNANKKLVLIILLSFTFVFVELLMYKTNNHVLETFEILIASACFYILFTNLKEIKNREMYNHYFVTYCSHFIVEPCMCKLIWIFLPHNDFFELFYVFGGTLLTVIIILVISYFIKRYLKPLWFLLTGENLMKKEFI